MRARPMGAIAASPTMVGAITVLIVIVAVFLAYNANTGLPFVPTYRITAQVPNANQLVPSNEVRIGGVRVGLVETVSPVQHEDGSTTARLDLKLDDEVRELPEDSTVIVRSRSSLGLKYLEIKKGSSEEGIPEGGTMPLSQAKPEPVEFDQILNTFDEPTRLAIQRNLVEFGNAIAARGPALNEAVGKLAPALRHLQPVTRILADPDTRLARFFLALRDTSAEVAPVADTQAQMFVVLNTTFNALANVARPFIQETISRTPPSFETLIQTTPTIRPFLRNTAGLFNDLAPGARALGRTAPELADAAVVGVPALLEAPGFNRQLPPTAASLRRFNDSDVVRTGITDLTNFADELSPTLRFITPAQSVCFYGSLLFYNVADTVRLGNSLGNWQRFIVLSAPGAPTAPDNEGVPGSGVASGGAGPASFLHSNPYPNTASPGQSPRECEAGREPYAPNTVQIGNPPGNQGVMPESITKPNKTVGGIE
ncbi:MAG TPA: MlaD family protein [Solirubrobacterales bacterium]|nr:MlaD family protein [Solirubrobacterales bacterium]